MSMISELIEELIDNADLHTKELHDLMYRAANTIVMLSEKAREPKQEWIPCSEVVGELVRCKECKKAHLTYDGECKYCDEWKDDDGNYIEVYHDGNHYCSYGVRKENK